MSNPLMYFWRHPRRTGFIVFNLVVIAALLGWAEFTKGMTQEGIAGVPNVMLGYTGMGFVLVAWIVGWLAWGVMVTSRHAKQKG
ncbi:MAG TPA: hypothetical protein VHZ56_08610 [Devosia sp.]|jgi:hypothetical protein|nr:hypothetical protein [Devosia sp.]